MGRIIFTEPPSVEELKNRLVRRGTDDQESITKRINKAEFELTFANKFDVIIVNDNLEFAVNQTKERITSFLEI